MKPAAVVVAAVLAACTAAAAPPSTPPTTTTSPSTTAPPTTTTSTSTTTTSTTTTPTTTTSTTTTTVPTPPTTEAPPEPGPLGVDLYMPETVEGAPVAVLVHGGGWVGGLPASTASLARGLASRGMVVFNASYRTLIAGGGYPGTFDDVACAVRYARAQAAELGASDDVTIVGHSAGAHLAAVIALTADSFGDDCAWPRSSVPARWVGLAGIYHLDSVAPIMELLLGGDRQALPEVWEAVDPYAHLEAAAGLETVLVHGAADFIVNPGESRALARALEDGGYEVRLEMVDGADHMDMLDPSVVADLIVSRSES